MYLYTLFLSSALLSFIGIGLKDHNPGIVVMGLGLIIMIFVILRKAIEVFGY